MKCKNCNKDFFEKYSKWSNGDYCSRSCANSYVRNNSIIKNKIVRCITCGKEFEVKGRSNDKNCKCDSCKSYKIFIGKSNKKITKKRCNICGEFFCQRKDICKHHQIFPSLIKYFGLDESKMKTIQIYEEYERIKILIKEEYLINKLSLIDLENKYGYPHQSISQILFKNLDINPRTSSESQNNAYMQGKYQNRICLNQYKCGWYITWNNKRIFYRSSYELDYCKELDEKKINYEVEHLRILYWDSQLLKQRVAIPDFYLPDTNEIIEIKSNWTYDEQNMKDKFVAYKQHGYIPKLILEHKEIIMAV